MLFFLPDLAKCTVVSQFEAAQLAVQPASWPALHLAFQLASSPTVPVIFTDPSVSPLPLRGVVEINSGTSALPQCLAFPQSPQDQGANNGLHRGSLGLSRSPPARFGSSISLLGDGLGIAVAGIKIAHVALSRAAPRPSGSCGLFFCFELQSSPCNYCSPWDLHSSQL